MSDLGDDDAADGAAQQDVRVTGRAAPEQAWPVATDAVLELVRRHPRARQVLVIVGDQPPARIYPALGPDGELDLPATGELLAALDGVVLEAAAARL